MSRRPGAVVVGGDYQGLGIVRSLGRYGVPVTVIDDERSISRVSRYVAHQERVAELRDADATVSILIETCKRLGLQGSVLYPTREETVAAIAVASRRAELIFSAADSRLVSGSTRVGQARDVSACRAAGDPDPPLLVPFVCC